MKKLLLLAAVAICSLSASAQFYYGGQLGFSRNATDNITSLTIAPEVGYTFNDTWSLGGVLDYDYRYYKGIDTNIFEISPYARYNFARLADDKLKFFCDFGVGFGVQKTKGFDAGFVYHIGFRPGISYALNDHYSLVAHLGQLGWEGATDKATGEYGRKNIFTWNIFDWNNVMFGFYYSF